MKIFLSHKFTGLSLEELYAHVDPLYDYLQKKKHEVFCSLYLTDRFLEQGWDTDTIYRRCLQEQQKSNIVVGIVRSHQPSRGMQLELDEAKRLHQQYVLLIKNDLLKELFVTNFKDYAHHIIAINETNELMYALEHKQLFQMI